MKKKISYIGKRALLPILVILFMVMGSFGSDLFVQNAEGGATVEGTIWDGDYPPGFLMGGFTYMMTVGMKFEVNREITIDEMGVCRYHGYPRNIYNIRLWDASTASMLVHVSPGYVPDNRWSWFSMTPITIPAGTYVISVGFSYKYMCGDYNPGPTPDGIIEPLRWCRRINTATQYPGEDMDATYAPYIDIHYSYDIVQAIDELINVVDGMAISPGLKNGLIAKLNAAKEALTDGNPHNDHVAINKLEDFKTKINNRPQGSGMTDPQATLLINAADDIIRMVHFS